MKHHLTCQSIDSSASNISYHCDMVWDNLFKGLAPVVRKVDNAIHRINHYPVDSVVCFANTYPLDSDLFGG